jgi:predicted AlkP superfamily pyrophosphatase or phosphodiesterase
MKIHALVCSLFLGLLASFAFAAEPQKDRCVILISVDGLANFYLDDPKADLPTLRKLAAEGARADGIVCSFPTVTWPNHTTLVTGVPPARHGVLGNSYYDRKEQKTVSLLPDPLFDKDEIVKVPTVYDAAHKAGLVTAGIVWPATRNAKTLDWTVPDMFGDEAWPKYGTPQWLAELRQAGLPIERHGTWTKEPTGGVQRDWLYSRMARHLLEHHPPNLLLIHLVEVDHVEHKFGPRSPEAYWSVSFADDRVRDIVDAARRSKFGDNVTVVVASDHGFFPIEKDIRPNALLRELKLVETIDGKVARQAWCVGQGGGCMVYVLNEGKRAAIVARLKEAFTGAEGIDAVFTAEEFAQIGQFTPQTDPRAPDLWLAAKSGYSFTDADSGTFIAPRDAKAGTHGYLPDHPEMLGSLILSGAGIKPGVRLGKVSNQTVAPTIAELLGIELPTADGKPLAAAISD